MRENALTTWLSNNIWNLLVTLFLIGVFYSSNVAGQTTQAKDIKDIREQLNRYPSEDYFELKFRTTDENARNNFDSTNRRIDLLTQKVEEHMKEDR